MFDVISIGSATLDVFLRSKGLEVEKENGALEICVPYGAKIEVDEIHFETGGGGTNTAVTFARQGLKAASVVQIGDDLGGKKVREDLEGEGVDTSFIAEEKDGYTDYSTILWAPDGGRTILVYRGKTRLEKQDVNWDKLRTKWFYISSIEGNLDIISHIILRQARDDAERSRSITYHISHAKIAWNPGAKELAQKDKLLSLLPGIEVLNLNKEEMKELLGIREIGEIGGIRELLKKAQELPCRYVVITDGQNGSYLWDGKIWFQAGIYKDAPRIETTGAGDAFGSRLVTGLIKRLSMEDCLRLASANASSVVGQVGGKKGILHQAEIKKWMARELEIEKVNA